jgi:hypothetical protein
VIRRLKLLFDALRPRSVLGLEARIEIRRAVIERLSGPRPRGSSAHSLPLAPSGPVLERVVVVPELRNAVHGWSSRSLHRLGETVVDGRTGIAVVEGRVLHQSGGVSSDKRSKAHDWHVVPYLSGVARRGDRATVRFDRPVHHLGHIPRGNYYHWLLEVLPRLLMVVEHEPDTIVLTPPLATFAEDALDLLGIEYRIITRPIRAASLLVVDAPESGWPHPCEVELVRSAGLRILDATGHEPDAKRIYVSRRRDTRSLADEDVVERRLQEVGFVVFDPRSHPRWADQVALFAGADLVVGPHGAGLSNAAFLPDDAHVIELQPDAYTADMFAVVCAARGIRHTALRLPVGSGTGRFGTAEQAISLLAPLIER